MRRWLVTYSVGFFQGVQRAGRNTPRPLSYFPVLWIVTSLRKENFTLASQFSSQWHVILFGYSGVRGRCPWWLVPFGHSCFSFSVLLFLFALKPKRKSEQKNNLLFVMDYYTRDYISNSIIIVLSPVRNDMLIMRFFAFTQNDT